MRPADVARRRRALPWAAAAAGLVAYAVLLALQRADELSELDSGNLVRAVELGFDPAADRPHPPGYPLLVLSARLLGGSLGARESYLALDIAFTVLAVAATTALAAAMFGRRAGAVAGLLLAAVPLVAYYGTIVSVYPAEMAFGPSIVLLAWRAAHDGDRRALVALPAAVALAGGFRPTSMQLLLPVVALALVLARPRARELAVALGLGLLVLVAWLVPMFTVTDWAAYWERSGDLGGSAASSASLLYGASPRQAALNVVLTAVALVGAALPALVVLGLGAVGRLRGAARARPTLRSPYTLLVVWVTPYVLLYAVVLFGKPGYAVVLAPAAATAAAGAVCRHRLALPVSALLAAVGLAYFSFSPLPGLPWRLATFAPTAQTVELQDAEARLAREIGRTCRPPQCAVVSLDPSRRTWTHSFDQLAFHEAPQSERVVLADVADLPRADVVLWVGHVVPPAVRRRAEPMDEAGTWTVLRTDAAGTRAVLTELAGGGAGS